jgi:transposase
MPIRSNKRHIKKLAQLLRRGGIDLWSLDECHFQQHGSRCAMWIPPEETDPVLLHAPTRKQVGMFGAVRIADGKLATRVEETFNGVSFGAFLEQLLTHRRPGRRLHLIVDNASYHHACFLRSWLQARRRWMVLDFLPPYSPELNPIERVWKITRRLCTHNRYFSTLQELVQSVQTQFTHWSQPNETLRRLCAII